MKHSDRPKIDGAVPFGAFASGLPADCEPGISQTCDDLERTWPRRALHVLVCDAQISWRQAGQDNGEIRSLHGVGHEVGYRDRHVSIDSEP